MADFSIEEVYKAFKITDDKLPFRSWLKRKKKKKAVNKKKSERKKPKNDGHIDIYA